MSGGGGIIQRKMSGGDSMEWNFQMGGYCPEGNYLGVTVKGAIVGGNFIGSNCGQKSEGNCPRGSFPGGN